jgi:cellulose synthase/poly-beta-1,6-N-acetylglucosamine synthase-like glycosyltransferase/peptidoglycan/xylan/chitin deacetylase (PgdA/CDA1 family)
VARPPASPTGLATRSSRGERDLGRKVERPPAHWLLLALFVGGLVLLLTADGITSHATGAAGTPSASHGSAVLDPSRPLLAGAGGRLVPEGQKPGKRLALTFDDGPDATWTPRIASVLEELHAPATFFVVGDRVVRNPGIVSDLYEHGFLIGNHTFSHANLSKLSPTRRDLEVSMTESAVAGAAGVRPLLLRPPYSSVPIAVDKTQADAFRSLTAEGYVIALSNIDAEDWRRPGVAEIVNTVASSKRAGVVLMHDGGGDRSETVAALRQLVPEMRARGYRFVGLPELLGTTAAAVEPPASSSEHLRGELLIGALGAAVLLVEVLAFLLVPIAILAILRAIVVVVLARRHVRRFRSLPAATGFTPPVSILVPAFNEAAGIVPAVRSLAGSDYPEVEVIVIDDGSTDDTAGLVERLRLPNVTVIREENRGKSEALNAGLAASSNEIIVAVDGDTVFEPDTIRQLVRPFSDERVGAVAGNTKVGNRGGILGRWQHIDYVMGFNLDRRLYDVLECMPTVPGAIGGFRRRALEEVGRFSSDTLAEDTDVTIALGRAGWKVVYAEKARGHTETPPTLSSLWRQRYRWSFGTMQSVWKHREALVRPRGRGIGRYGLPYLLAFQVVLPLLAPLIDLFALYGLVFLNPLPVIGYWVAFNLLMLALAAYAFRLDGESLRPLWALPLQQFVYRQLMYLVVIQSIASAAQGARMRWHHTERSGDVEIAST